MVGIFTYLHAQVIVREKCIECMLLWPTKYLIETGVSVFAHIFQTFPRKFRSWNQLTESSQKCNRTRHGSFAGSYGPRVAPYVYNTHKHGFATYLYY